MRDSIKVSSIILCSFLLFCCNTDTSQPIHYDDTTIAAEENAGGEGTVYDQSVNAFSFPYRTLSSEQRSDFFIGNSLFNQNWVQAPASTSLRDGVGPLFNARSCSGCHFKDGRGTPPNNGEPMISMLLRLSIPGTSDDGSPLPEPHNGGQLQNFAVSGVKPEGKPIIEYQEIPGKFEDGEYYSLRKPIYKINDLAYGNMQENVMVSPRVAPQMIGMGLLEAINETDILNNADEFDNNNDGISGKANRVYDRETQSLRMGRFGWKANQPTVKQQVAGAFNGDLGVTSSVFPMHGHGDNQKELDKLPHGGTPEISDMELEKVILYSAVLAVPAARSVANMQQGKKIFMSIGCASCHRPSYTTGSYDKISVLSHQKIYPYTDLLLHDMGDELADNRPDFAATGTEWRTPPLWGIGLIPVVNGHSNYLHDGRARSLQEAILWHGGEGEAAREKYKKLSKKEREELLKFLNSL
jgi:CxxC motif-containing protein (DUF1111 family)